MQRADRLDLAGKALSALAIVLIVFPLYEGHVHHWRLWCCGGWVSLLALMRARMFCLPKQANNQDD
ncbi:hypothetical protein [Streptomyces sp. NPDC058308]|uniref:hypothetical protein n=1 Tax=Streptomyces sp. NPDC058308 TaxID=3346440 RepID=UPI0036EF973A